MQSNLNHNLLLIASFLAACIIAFVHIFLFPLYDVPKQGAVKTYGDYEQSLCVTNLQRRPVNYQHIFNSFDKRNSNKLQQLFQLCPRDGIVTVFQGGRLGNQIWEYAGVWAVARRTGLDPYVPSCIRERLDQVFENLSVPTLQTIGHCPVKWTNFARTLDEWNYINQSILLPRFTTLPEIVLIWVQDIQKEFQFKKRLVDQATKILSKILDRHIEIKFKEINQEILVRFYENNQLNKLNKRDTKKQISKKYKQIKMKSNENITDILNKKIYKTFERNAKLQNYTWIGVHVRRTDYKAYLWRKKNMELIGVEYFFKAMNYFETKYDNCIFVVVSDDPEWCYDNFSIRKNVYVVNKFSKLVSGFMDTPGQDLALMAACNHSIIDYGTYGSWGAILAGGETVSYRTSNHSTTRISDLLPDWHLMD